MRRYCLGLAMLSLAALGPVAVRGDDQQIAQEIVKKLQAEKQAGTLKGFSIDLQVDEGTVWLTGRVSNEQQLTRALDLARRVSGVQQVVNGLDVSAPPANTSRAAATASQPQPAKQPAYSARPSLEPVPVERPQMASKPNTPAHSSVLNSVSKALMSAVHGSRAEEPQPAQMQMITARPMPIHPEANYAEPTPAEPEPAYTGVQAASVNQEFATMASTGPIGSGVSPSAPQHVTVQPIQPMQTAASYPSPYQPAPMAQQAMAESPQPLPGYGPQGGRPAPYAQMAMMPMGAPYAAAIPVYAGTQNQVPLAMGPARTVNYAQVAGPMPVEGGPVAAPAPMYMPGSGVGIAPARYDHPTMPGYAWPSYACSPNYAAVTYPKQYSPTAWPYIGPFYPYPQVPLGWRKVTLEWDDGWWMLDFKDRRFGGGHF
jgi:hypothetical protein